MQYKKPGIESFTVKPGKSRDKPQPESCFGEDLSEIEVIQKTAPSIAQRWCSVLPGYGQMALVQGFQAVLLVMRRLICGEEINLWRGDLSPLGCEAAPIQATQSA
ncbi:hypothetical protein C0J56_23630 [Pseudomonas fluorescens]|nr:hypothetical protein C0J56_23630 [Pseudomonas fluorescens]